MIHRLPIFSIVLGEEEGIRKMSLVNMPAVDSDFQAFAAKKEYKFAVDDEQHIVFGCALRADYPIYRYSPHTGEFYVVFSRETIKELYEKFMIECPNRVNLEHETDTEGVFLIQSFIKDSATGMVPKGFEDIEDGSWFVAYKVLNDEVWKSVKDGTFKGFSIEGYFDLVDTPFVVESEYKKDIEGQLEEFVSADRAIYAIDHAYYCDISLRKEVITMAVVLAYGADKDGDDSVLYWTAGTGKKVAKLKDIDYIHLTQRITNVPDEITEVNASQYLTQVYKVAQYEASDKDKPEEPDDLRSLSMAEKIKYAIEHHSYCVMEYADADNVYTFREVVIYVHGLSKYSGKEALRVYHTAGDTTSGHVPYWRLMLVERIKSLTIDTAMGTRNNPDALYNPTNDKGMTKIFQQAKF